jgi:hypothetical protein
MLKGEDKEVLDNNSKTNGGEVKKGCPGSYVGKGRMAKETKINENRRIWDLCRKAALGLFFALVWECFFSACLPASPSQVEGE